MSVRLNQAIKFWGRVPVAERPSKLPGGYWPHRLSAKRRLQRRIRDPGASSQLCETPSSPRASGLQLRRHHNHDQTASSESEWRLAIKLRLTVFAGPLVGASARGSRLHRCPMSGGTGCAAGSPCTPSAAPRRSNVWRVWRQEVCHQRDRRRLRICSRLGLRRLETRFLAAAPRGAASGRSRASVPKGVMPIAMPPRSLVTLPAVP